MKKLNLQEILNLEKEIELLETKIRLKFFEPGIQAKIYHILGIDRTQLSHFAHKRRNFSIERLFQIAKILVKK